MFIRQWCAPFTGTLTILYFLLVYGVATSASPGPLLRAITAPGLLVLFMGTPLLEPFGLTEWSLLGYTPTSAGYVALVVVYTFCIANLAGFLGSFTRR